MKNNHQRYERAHYLVRGGKPLFGTIDLQGSKHSYAAILTAAVLSQKDVNIKNVPNISDVKNFVEMLKDIGIPIAEVGENTIKVNAWSPSKYVCIPPKFLSRFRDSIYVFALAGLFDEMKISTQFGGCELGDRPINSQLSVLTSLGYQVEVGTNWVEIKKASKFTTKKMRLGSKSVSATKIGILLAALDCKEIILENIALEPNVFDLIRFLRNLGVEIDFIDYSKLLIKKGLQTTTLLDDYEILEDRMEAATIIAATAITNGMVKISNLNLDHLGFAYGLFRDIGIDFTSDGKGTTIKVMKEQKSGVSFETGYFPMVCTDMHPPMAALLAVCHGISCIRETVFRNRWQYLSELKKMGADWFINGDSVSIVGVPELNSAEVFGRDIRGTAALMIAALVAKGETILWGDKYLRRAYQNLPEKLVQLGADINFVSD